MTVINALDPIEARPPARPELPDSHYRKEESVVIYLPKYEHCVPIVSDLGVLNDNMADYATHIAELSQKIAVDQHRHNKPGITGSGVQIHYYGRYGECYASMCLFGKLLPLSVNNFGGDRNSKPDFLDIYEVKSTHRNNYERKLAKQEPLFGVGQHELQGHYVYILVVRDPGSETPDDRYHIRDYKGWVMGWAYGDEIIAQHEYYNFDTFNANSWYQQWYCRQLNPMHTLPASDGYREYVATGELVWDREYIQYKHDPTPFRERGMFGF